MRNRPQPFFGYFVSNHRSHSYSYAPSDFKQNSSKTDSPRFNKNWGTGSKTVTSRTCAPAAFCRGGVFYGRRSASGCQIATGSTPK